MKTNLKIQGEGVRQLIEDLNKIPTDINITQKIDLNEISKKLAKEFGKKVSL